MIDLFSLMEKLDDRDHILFRISCGLGNDRHRVATAYIWDIYT